MIVTRNAKALLPTVGLLLLAWILSLVGLFFVQRNCGGHGIKHFYSAAQLPETHDCGKVFRYHWTTVLLQLPIALGLIGSIIGWFGLSESMLHRFRLPLLGFLAAVTPLQIWSANVFLNLTDTTTRQYLSDGEINWARIAAAGFAAVAAINFVLMYLLGEDLGDSFTRDSDIIREPLVSSA